jgi:hypothetical protein
MKLNVHIERLVIDSGTRLTREHLTEAIRRELGARIAADGLPSQLNTSSMRESAPAQTSESPRAGLGNAIYGSLQQ